MISLSDRLLSPWGLRALAIGLLLALVAVFPARHLLELGQPSLSQDRHAALMYAQARLNAEPERQDYRLALARLQLDIGDLRAAGETLGVLEGSASLKVRWWILEHRWRRYFAQRSSESGDGDDAIHLLGEGLEERLRDYQQRVATEAQQQGHLADTARMEIVARRWLVLGRPEQAASCYELLAEFDRLQRFNWYSAAGRYWLEAGEPLLSAQSWHKAWLNGTQQHQLTDAPDARLMQPVVVPEAATSRGIGDGPVPPGSAPNNAASVPRREGAAEAGATAAPDLGWLGWWIAPAWSQDSVDRDRRRQAAQHALRAAEQGGEPQLALSFMHEYLDAYPNDPELLDIAVRLAMAAGTPDLAMDWSRRLVRLRPDETVLLVRHAAIAVILDDPGLAIEVLLRLRQQEPGNLDHLESLASLERWRGNAMASLAYRVELAKASADGDRERAVIDLALALHDRPTALEALQRLQAGGTLGIGERRQLVDMLDALGRPEDAIEELRRWQSLGLTDNTLLARLATLLEQTGKLDAATLIWADIATRLGDGGIDATLQHSRLLTRQWDLEGAQAVLTGITTDDAGERALPKAYWERRAELAFSLGDAAETTRSLRGVASGRALEGYEQNLLMQAAREEQDIALVVRLAERRWQESGDAQGIIQGFQLAQDMRRPDMARRLLGLAEAAPDAFRHLPEYWIAAGAEALEAGRLDDAHDAYATGLVLAPENLSLMAGTLRLSASLGDRSRLNALLSRSRSRGLESLDLTLAIANGYRALGQPGLGLAWAWLAEAHYPSDPRRLLDIADLERETGNARAAYAATRAAFSGLLPELAAALDAPLGEVAAGEQLAALTAALPYLGAERTARWHDAVITELNDLDTTSDTRSDLALEALLALQQRARYRFLWLRRQAAGPPSSPHHAIAIASQDNNLRELARLVDAPQAPLGTQQRFFANLQLGRRQMALTEGYTLSAEAGEDHRVDIAALRQEMPRRVAATTLYQELGDLVIESTQARVETAGDRWSARLDLSQRRLDADELETPVDAAGIDRERYAELSIGFNGLRGDTRVALGLGESDDEQHLSAELEQRWALTPRLEGRLFAGLGQPSQSSDLLRLLATEDEIGAGLDWQLTARDQLAFTASQRRYRDREDRERLGDAIRSDVQWSHGLIRGATRLVDLRLFASHEQQDSVDRLPDAIAERLPDGSTPDTLISGDSSFIGAGISLARGEPGAPFPDVASPRWRVDVSSGYRLPDGDFAGNLNVAVGSRVFSGDELSLSLNVDGGTGVDDTTRVGAALTYQVFLGR